MKVFLTFVALFTVSVNMMVFHDDMRIYNGIRGNIESAAENCAHGASPQITDNPQGIGNIEYAYHRMAKACGIDMMECRLLQEKESYHFMTRCRY